MGISCFPSGSCLAQLRHTRTANMPGGALLNASDPGIPLIADLSVENLGIGGGQHPSFRIQFTRQNPGLGHTLTFRDSVMNKTNTQPFNNVAFIALGQWMRSMGDPSLNVKAPYTGNTPITWTISISPDQNMTLSWIME